MSRFMNRAALALGALATAIAFTVPARAADVVLLPNGLMEPTTKEQTAPNQFKKAPPWRIGVSFPGVGNTWIVQLFQEMKYEASLHKEIKDFTIVEANWTPAKQVADVEDLITKKVDLIIFSPISIAEGAPLLEKIVKAGIPVVELSGKTAGQPTTVIGAGGEVFGYQGGEYLRKVLNGKGNIWAFRGVAGSDEETWRYDGFRKALAGSDIKITHEVFGDWNYAKGKKLCENLVLSGDPVDGIWFSGAEMTRACLDVFKENGKALVPMTGEGNNGFLRIWKQTGVKSVAPLFTPALGAAVVRASVALLEGKQLYKSYFSNPAPIVQSDLDKYYRPDLNDAYWVPSALPDAKLKELFHR